MKKFLILASIVLIGGCETAADHRATMQKLMNDGRCSDAESYAYRNFREEYLDWMLGNVALICRKNRRKAIEYFKAGARPNKEFSHLSVRSLIELGEKPPEQTTRYIRVPAPAPAPPPQTIIIQQQPPGSKLGACIQDGGSLYCPNHPSTRPLPPVFR